MRKRLLIGIAVFCMAFCLWNIIRYRCLQNKGRELLSYSSDCIIEDPVDLIGMLDSMGVPYSPLVPHGFMHYLEKILERNGAVRSSLDLFNLYINKTWELNGIFQNRITIGQYADTQNFSLDFTRHKYMDRVRNDLHYFPPSDQENVSIYDYTKACSNPVILYSCAANNLFYYFDMSPENLTVSKVCSLVTNWKKGLLLLEEEIESNIETISECNENAQIYIMGLYVPTDHFILQRLGTPLINSVNQRIKTVCKRYDSVYFVDISCLSFYILDGDFHPNAEGQKVISHLLAQSLCEHADEPRSEHGNSNNSIRKDFRKPALQSSSKCLVSVKALSDFVDQSGLPMDDYVEAAVALEEGLSCLDCPTCSAEDLKHLEREWLALYGNDNKEAEVFKRAFEIMIIEREIHEGFNLEQYSLKPGTVNDKISLITYYNRNR